MAVLILSVVFAFVLGFSAHRTGICTVAAVGEVITSRTARTFASFLKVVLWVLLINGVAVVILPDRLTSYQPAMFSLWVLAGGFLFGVGAAINGGCSFSTISKLAQGELHVALTLPAFVLGLVAANELVAGALPGWQISLFAIDFSALPPLLLLALLGLAAYELVRLVLPVFRSGLYAAFTSKRYRLSSAAALIGVCSGFLYLFHGRWAYSSRIVDLFAERNTTPGASESGWLLILALLAGAVVSALTNRTWKISFAGGKWHKNLTGGFLMGFGAMLVPGGNGKLILHDLPHLSAQALLAYLAMIAGIAVTLTAMLWLFGEVDVVSCDGDECSVTKPARRVD